MRFYLPLIDECLKQAGFEKKPLISVYSSMNQPYPIASIEVPNNNQTPEIFNLFLGMGLGDIQYQLISDLDAKPIFGREEREEAKLSNFLKIPPMMIEEIENSLTSNSGTSKFFLRSDLCISQLSGLQKYFNDTNAKDVMKTLAASNKSWQSYNLKFAKSDHSTSIFRKASHTDLSFIEEQVYPNYLINGNCPKFWVGIDNSIHLDSISNLLKNNDSPDALLMLGLQPDDKLINSLLKAVESKIKKTGAFLQANTYKLNIGWKNSLRDLIKPAVYSFDNSMPYSPSISKLVCNTVDTRGKRLPINSLLNLSASSSKIVSMDYRPNSNIAIESKNNLFRDQPGLIRLHVERSSISYGNLATNEESILSAGSVISVIFPYIYSIYNGSYVVESIEYKTDQLSPERIFVALDLVSTSLDLTCYETLSGHKDSEDFSLDYAPAVLTDVLMKSE